ncbi:hypothetical protein ABPG75_013722 [Micractinium tetrahymenae]
MRTRLALALLVLACAAACQAAGSSAAGRFSLPFRRTTHHTKFGTLTAMCPTFDPKTEDWGTARTPKYDAKGSATPDNATTTQFGALICSDPRTAAKQFMQMVGAGGTQAQAAVYAYLELATPDPSCKANVNKFYNYFTSLVTGDGDPAQLQSARDFFSNFVEAADAVGIPIVYNPDSHTDVYEEILHTGSQF